MLVAVAFTRGTFVQRMRRASRHVDRGAAVLLVAAGVYIAFYWAFTLAMAAGSDGGLWSRVAERPVELLEHVSTWAVHRLEQWALPLAVVLSGVVFSAVWVVSGRATVCGDHDGIDDASLNSSRQQDSRRG